MPEWKGSRSTYCKVLISWTIESQAGPPFNVILLVFNPWSRSWFLLIIYSGGKTARFFKKMTRKSD